QDLPFRRADVDHRLDSEDHAGPQADAPPGRAHMRDAGRLVQTAAHAVPAPFTHHAQAVRFGVGLDGGANIADARAGLRRLDAQVKTFAGYVQETLHPGSHFAHGIGDAGIAAPAVQAHADVYANNVAFMQAAAIRHAVADFLVDGGTDRAGEGWLGRRAAAIALVQRFCPPA